MGNGEYVDIKQEVKLSGEGSRVDSQHSQISGQTDAGKLNMNKKKLAKLAYVHIIGNCIIMILTSK